ncbi:hypothetical protein B0H16DRAFT_1485013 [Mycena metata]|uniref:Uncharacterized protein n=1 Tax=Mycena metata TaxID=1033252 RepID=A0AAD7GMQ0_9AGAR|nr:hypothetical protein B0H16DRAFT_1485013 [Mycena metata]
MQAYNYFPGSSREPPEGSQRDSGSAAALRATASCFLFQCGLRPPTIIKRDRERLRGALRSSCGALDPYPARTRTHGHLSFAGRITEGDTVVQRGTMHVWRNETTEWAKVYFVMLGAQPIEIKGQKLEEEFHPADKLKIVAGMKNFLGIASNSERRITGSPLPPIAEEKTGAASVVVKGLIKGGPQN